MFAHAGPAALLPRRLPRGRLSRRRAVRRGRGGPLLDLLVRLAVAAALATVAALFFLRAAGDLAGGPRALLPVALETFLIFAFFAFVPPVLAVGLYFTLWHAPRHVARLVLLDPAGSRHLGAGRPTRALARFAAEAAPLTVLALALLLAVPRMSGEPASLLALYLVLISALTLPHAVIVASTDARQGVRRRPLVVSAGEGR